MMCSGSLGNVVIFLLFIYSLLPSNRAFDENQQCSNQCSLEDDRLDCWEFTEKHFIMQLIETVNNFSGVEIMLARWRRKHGIEDANITDVVERVINRTDVMSAENVDGVLNSTYLLPILRMTITETIKWASAEHDPGAFNYSYHCPVPCDYLNTLWIYLFTCVCLVLVLTIIYVAIHMVRLKREAKKRLI